MRLDRRIELTSLARYAETATVIHDWLVPGVISAPVDGMYR
jgi:hypothetical protein